MQSLERLRDLQIFDNDLMIIISSFHVWAARQEVRLEIIRKSVQNAVWKPTKYCTKIVQKPTKYCSKIHQIVLQNH
jgi:fructose-specific phosphotransferase system component IIB